MRVIGMVGQGAFADAANIKATRLMPRPLSMPAVTAAGFSMTYGTSMHALKQRAQLKAGETSWCSGPAAAWGWPLSSLARPWARPSSLRRAVLRSSMWPIK